MFVQRLISVVLSGFRRTDLRYPCQGLIATLVHQIMPIHHRVDGSELHLLHEAASLGSVLIWLVAAR